MGTILKSWKTSVIGLVAGGLMIAGSIYQPGMSWKQWGSGVGIALLGLLSKDHDVTGGS